MNDLEHDHCGDEHPHRRHAMGNVLCHGTTIEEAAMEDDEVKCPLHGIVKVTEFGANKGGFAGGTVYWWTLSCGCQDMDESSDVAAAM